MTQANVATGLGWPSASPAGAGAEPGEDRGTSLGWPERIPAAPDATSNQPAADLAPAATSPEPPDGPVPPVAADPGSSASQAAPGEPGHDFHSGSIPTAPPTSGSSPAVTVAESIAASESPGDKPPARPLQARESLVRDALAQLANDVSRETEAAAQPDHVSRETSHPDVSRETVPAPEELADTPIAAAAATAMRVRDTSDVFPRPPQTRIVTIANQKGGVGKTTTTVNLATALALHGSRVLCIDLDPQGNASTGLGIDHQSGTPSIYEVLINDRPMREVVQEAAVPGLFCAPATIDLAGAEIELVSVVARETRLRRAIAAYEQPLDYVLIDCPPSLGLLTVNALVAAQEMLIPIQCEYYALEGLGQLLRNVDLIRSHLNQDLAVSTILLTMYDGRTRLAEQVAEEVRSHFGELVLGTAIPRSVRISEAPGYGQSVLTYDPASRGAVAYLAAAREFAERGARPATEESR